MSKQKITIIAVILLGLIGMTVLAVEQQWMSVQVKKGCVRATASFLGKIITGLQYGDQVEVQEIKGSWCQIRVPDANVAGWMHSSALTRKKILLQAGNLDADQAATTDEISLAGRGFNQQVEDEFKRQNPDIDFTWIDRMERMVVSQRDMQQFILEGQLSPQGGEE